MKIKVGTVSVDLIEARDRCCVHERRGGFEPHTLAAWADLMQRKGQVIDVGAYTGLYAIAAALHGRAAVAFEPFPDNAERFNDNAKANGVRSRIRIIEAAAWSTNGAGTLRYNPGVSDLTSGASLVYGEKELRVPLMAIDLLALKNVSAIKIDAERAEAMVLVGAHDTILRCKPALIVEALDEEQEAAILSAVRGYAIEARLDRHNLLLGPVC